jgi:hypothetical protein
MFCATAAKTRPGGNQWFPAIQSREKLATDSAQKAAGRHWAGGLLR